MVNRYDPNWSIYRMDQVESGDYVDYEDFKLLDSENKDLTRQLAEAESDLRKRNKQLTDCDLKLVEAREEIERLREALQVIIRNIDTHVATNFWIRDFSKRSLEASDE